MSLRLSNFVAAFVTILTLSSATTALAQVCVTIDTERDNLTEEEQKATRMLLLQAFEDQKAIVDRENANCMENYNLFHVRLGKTINVTVAGARGQRNARATGLDDLGNVYSQMVISLLSGKPMETGGGTTDRKNVTKEQSAPRRVAADSLKYVTLGYGFVTGGDFNHGPAFGFGYRKELDMIGIDISFFNLIWADSGDSFQASFTGSFVRLMGMYYQDAVSDSTLYYGGGLSWGGTAMVDDGVLYDGSGIQGEVVVGYEALRSSTIRGFLQLQATLPFYMSDADFGGGDSRYTPALSMVVGLGWGKSNVVRVINE